MHWALIKINLIIFGVLWVTYASAENSDISVCQSIKDSKQQAICFKSVAKKLSEAKQAEGDTKTFVVRSKQEATKSFLDPDSAKFRGLIVTKDNTGKSLCGEVNGKNQFGGYVGYRRFFLSFSDAEDKFSDVNIEEVTSPKTTLDQLKADVFDSTWKLICTTFPIVWHE